MAHTPRVAVCHVTASSSSATETLKPAFNFSLSDRTTCRRSLSDCACSMRSSRVRLAMGMDVVRVYAANFRWWQGQLTLLFRASLGFREEERYLLRPRRLRRQADDDKAK